MKNIKTAAFQKMEQSTEYVEMLNQKTHCPKCGAQQGHKNVINPSNPSVYECNCGHRFNPDNEKPQVPSVPSIPR